MAVDGHARAIRHLVGSVRRRGTGQGLVEFALIIPVILLLVLGAIDFGRYMQARITAESAVRAGASWGATNLQNATQPLGPVYAVSTKTCTYGPTCNIEYRACIEAAGLPGYSGGAVLTGGGKNPLHYQDCATGTAGNVCQPGATQSNPFLTVTWRHPDGTTFSPDGVNVQAEVGDSVEVDGTFCFQTFFPYPAIAHQLTWTSRSVFVVQP